MQKNQADEFFKGPFFSTSPFPIVSLKTMKSAVEQQHAERLGKHDWLCLSDLTVTLWCKIL